MEREPLSLSKQRTKIRKVIQEGINFYTTINIINIMRCEKCGYEWKPRTKNPKQCPLCKQYLERFKEEIKENAQKETKK